ncbi:hypothetical protein G9A89_010681 [Geosiphon pyriformis]|nr:hypothetical protein G9A89_010681 [Geosiphon pyriformis]
MPDAIKQRHEALKREMSIGSHLPLEQITKRMYHGTSYTCDAMAIIKTRKPCGLTRCSMCGIVKAGNSGTKSKWNGKMYFASNPATALPYSRRPMADSCAPRVMFIADVLAPEYDDVVGTCQEAAALPRYLVIFEREIEY